MRESGEPMEFGIFDFYKVFSRAFGEEEDGAGGNWSGRWGCREYGQRWSRRERPLKMMQLLINFQDCRNNKLLLS